MSPREIQSGSIIINIEDEAGSPEYLVLGVGERGYLSLPLVQGEGTVSLLPALDKGLTVIPPSQAVQYCPANNSLAPYIPLIMDILQKGGQVAAV